MINTHFCFGLVSLRSFLVMCRKKFPLRFSMQSIVADGGKKRSLKRKKLITKHDLQILNSHKHIKYI